VLRDGTGKGIHVNATQAKGRFCISGMWPFDSARQQSIPDKPLHISIARNRPPEKIAADLQKRFLPWYMAAYAEQIERAAQHDARRNRQQEVTNELGLMLGDDAMCSLQSVHGHGLTVDVDNGGETASVQLRGKSIKTVKAILRAYVKAGGVTE
jgi:hypothetical protein